MEQRGFAEAFLPAGFGRNARLERIAGLIDWAPVEVLVRRVRPGTTGRPPYRALAMVRALLLQQWYGLSDPGLEEALSDRVSFRRFCGLALEEPTPACPREGGGDDLVPVPAGAGGGGAG